MNCIDEIEGLKMIMDGTIHMAPKQSQVAQNQMRRNMGDYAEVHGPHRANRGYSASLQPLQVHNGLSNPPRASTLLAPKQSQVAQNQMRRNMGDYAEAHGPHRANRGYSASLQPLQVHNGLSNPPRASTLRECELIIRQLYNTNRSQSQQIVRYKELLEDIVLNKRKRITPENYNLTKAFLADDIWTAVGLPALTQGLNSSVAERQRRNRAVHRSHVKGTVR
ncbi:coiled-coil domain-containing protein 74A-like isoform X2 [Syngnathus typhle]|uniref:coiled-coil domain-containing protein 74A-like isoform X2 n=1 Tax=Syngnathus typhle TaxID=161592 RepID=UPI002A6ACC59|nr:coiled-coil domain-containing protein 74A-like isoform X2 [Syngnathus typhle]